MKKIWLVIPAYNEGRRLTQLVKKIDKLDLDLPLLIVDDGSHRPLNLDHSSLIILRHQVNLGKGAALKTGANFCFSNGAQAVIFMDADGQHDPAELPRFISLLGQNYDLIFGSRRPSLNTPLIRFLGNKFASIYINLVFGVYISDILSGFRALNRRAYRMLTWQSPRYGVETEMVARLGKHKHTLKFIELPVDTIYIDKYKGVTIVDALQILFNSIWWKLS